MSTNFNCNWNEIFNHNGIDFETLVNHIVEIYDFLEPPQQYKYCNELAKIEFDMCFTNYANEKSSEPEIYIDTSHPDFNISTMSVEFEPDINDQDIYDW